MAVKGTHAYVADSGPGLQVIDITNPENPQIVGSVDTPDYAEGVAVGGTHAHIADLASGLRILPLQCEPSSGVGEDDRVTSEMLLRAYPNPRSCQVSIHSETRNEGQLQASVYDAAGRLVRRLFNGVVPAGDQDLLWDGRNEEGGAVAAGISFVRVSSAEGIRKVRCLVVR